MEKGILLQSGINQLELVIFKVGDSLLGINVAKVECIITPQPITKIPNSNRNVKGVINYRGRVLPVLDLASALNKNYQDSHHKGLLILVHINSISFSVEVSSVVGIKRLSWDEIETPSSMLVSKNDTPTTGMVKTDKEEVILILDFEKIISDIDPSLALKESKVYEGLRGKKIVVAEDSSFLLNIVEKSFLKAGAQVEKFNNGKGALDFLLTVSKNEIHCVITDIEMPIMDGLTLTKKIKENPQLLDVPVILFSSIVNDTLKHQGISVGADAQITKPEIDKLVDLVITIRK